jgi:hypothetical protein
MAAIGTIGIKDSKGKYKNFTIGLNDDTNQYGQNIAIWEEQSKEDREAKKPRVYGVMVESYGLMASVK